MGRIIDIDVGAWSGIRCFNFLVAGPVITTVEGSMNCLFCNNLVFNIILLFLVIILTGPRILRKRLSGIRSLALMLPEFAPLGFSQE